MNFFYDRGANLERIPWFLRRGLLMHGLHMHFYKDDYKQIVQDHKVELIFEERDNGGFVLVSSSNDSLFFFKIGFVTEEQKDINVRKEYDAIYQLANMRNVYIMAFGDIGVKNITFTTKDEKYKEFVDKLNESYQGIATTN